MKGPIVVERSRGVLRVTGRDPVKMVHGLATADITRLTPGQGTYTAFLTPKGKMVADARVFLEPGDPPRESGQATTLLVDTAPDALPGLTDHLARYVPPLFARAEDASGEWAVVGVYGPGADAAVATAFESAPIAPSATPGSAPAAGSAPGSDAGDPDERVVPLNAVGSRAFAVRTRLTGDPGWDLFVPAPRRESVVRALLEGGGRPGDPDALEALRIAAGVPRWGRELTEDVIPLEAGLLDRAIDQDKGCYTGQEVIVRILHRGHVNRYLRRLEFLEEPPEPGTEIFEEGVDRPRGVVTSAIANDAGALGLGYVRREVEPPAELRVGSPTGDPVRVTALDD